MSTLSVTTINTANGTTDLTLATGNTNAGDIIVNSGGGLVLASNSTVNAITVNSTAGISTATNTFVIGSSLFVSASGNVGIGNSAPATELQISGNYGILGTTLTAGNNHNVNCALGNYFVVVANSSAQNVYFTSTPANTVYSMTLRFSNGAGGNTISWANTPKWPSASAPTPSTNNDIWVFITDDGGTTWRGNLVQRDSR
jgi:hypothetical protein